MVRNPTTVQAEDAVEHCLQLGRELKVGQFPVLEGSQVVGIISGAEMFHLAAHLLGAWERRTGVTLAPVKLGPGVLGRIADVVEATGAVLQAIYPHRRHDKESHEGYPEKKVILRFKAEEVGDVVLALEEAGFPVIEIGNQKSKQVA